MSNQKMLPYILPAITIIAGMLFFLKPNITGFAVVGEQRPDISIIITFYQNELLPESTEVVVILNHEELAFPLRKILEKSGRPYNHTSGELEAIGYSGYGFRGNGTYAATLSSLGADLIIPKGAHNLTTRIIFNQTVLTEDSREINSGS